MKKRKFSKLSWWLTNIVIGLLPGIIFTLFWIVIPALLTAGHVRKLWTAVGVMLFWAPLAMPFAIFIFNVIRFGKTKRYVWIFIATVVVSLTALLLLVLSPYLVLAGRNIVGIFAIMFSPAIIAIVGSCCMIAESYKTAVSSRKKQRIPRRYAWKSGK